MLGAESLDELDVLLLVARLDENAEVGLTTVKGLGALSQATGKTIVDESLLEDLLRVKSQSMFKCGRLSTVARSSPPGERPQCSCHLQRQGRHRSPRPAQPRQRRRESPRCRTFCTKKVKLVIVRMWASSMDRQARPQPF